MHQIPPKARFEVDQTFYTTGKSSSNISPQRFSKHIAEPGEASSILARNPHHSVQLDIKPNCMRQSPLTERYNAEVLSLPLVKQIQSREYSNKAHAPSKNCSKTVTKEDFHIQNNDLQQTPLTENWLYCTRTKPYNVKAEDVFKVTDQTPEWFHSHKPSESLPKEPTLTVFSRLSGWIYVSAQSRNRKHRLGRSGPYNDGEPVNFQKVSSLAPNWMQRESASSVPVNHGRNFKPPPFLRGEQKRMILVQDNQPEKSLFSLGDFRHDLRTTDEVNTYNQTAVAQPKNFFEWKEDVGKQRFDKPVTEKIGVRINK